MATLLTQDEAQVALGRKSDDDGRIAAALARVSAAIEKFTGRTFAAAARTDYLDGKDQKFLIVKTRPLNTLTSIADQWDTDGDPLLDLTTVDFSPESGLIWIKETTIPESGPIAYWSRGLRRWKVIYNGGFATIPDDVKQAAVITLQDWFNWSGSDHKETLGDYSREREAQGIPEAARMVLAPYVEVAF